MKKVLIFGSFDSIHPGHLSIIHQARQFGDVHAVLALDETIQQIKGRRPAYTESERKRRLEDTGVVVHLGSRRDRLAVFKEVEPDIVLLGYDQKVFVEELREHISKNRLSTKIQLAQAFKTEIFKSSKIRSVQEDAMSGFIMIDKESGSTSMRVVSILRKKLNMKKIGFAGTLDPLASGLLVCATGSATKIIDWWHTFPKEYVVTAKLGHISDSYDRDGTISRKKLRTLPREEKIIKAVHSFLGASTQRPPMFSAKQVRGRRLYELARKGKIIRRKKHTIIIHDIDVVSIDGDEVSLRVVCSTGTYIRTLVHDLGKKLRTGAVVWKLRRTKIGPFSVDDAYRVDEIKKETIAGQFLEIESVLRSVNHELFPEI